MQSSGTIRLGDFCPYQMSNYRCVFPGPQRFHRLALKKNQIIQNMWYDHVLHRHGNSEVSSRDMSACKYLCLMSACKRHVGMQVLVYKCAFVLMRASEWQQGERTVREREGKEETDGAIAGSSFARIDVNHNKLVGCSFDNQPDAHQMRSRSSVSVSVTCPVMTWAM